VDQHERVADWADAVLKRHPTAPAGSASIEDEPFAEQLQRGRERHAAFAKAEALVWLIGAVLLCGFGYAWLSTF
jgi:hypothetical protein